MSSWVKGRCPSLRAFGGPSVGRSKQIAGLFFLPADTSQDYKPPAYVKSGSFQTREVVVGDGEWALPGTLTLPQGKGPFPALALVHGSGPHDRDETIGPNKPFRDLAEGLASQGIAVVRYEKRTQAYAQKLASVKNFTVDEETVDDAVAVVTLLRKTPGIDPRRVFVLVSRPQSGRHDPAPGGEIGSAGTRLDRHGRRDPSTGRGDSGAVHLHRRTERPPVC